MKPPECKPPAQCADCELFHDGECWKGAEHLLELIRGPEEDIGLMLGPPYPAPTADCNPGNNLKNKVPKPKRRTAKK
jgi:hypothetical protein